LKNRGFVSPPDAQTFVDSEMLDDPVLARRDAGIPLPPPDLLHKPVAAAHAVGLGIILVTALLSLFVPMGAPMPAAAQSVVPAPQGTKAVIIKNVRPAPSSPQGFLRVVVDPWAKILVDGEYYDTTPFAAPLRLTPGSHRISFRNPYCEPSDRMVEIKEGKTAELKVALIPRQAQEPREPR
jgi:hypothetical protein